ncbi:hypothetical protein DCS_01971 [Drechmeria coniospora]|uniref:WSC domain-containing protein n=1 Tax=Drechmeria coniospora TaxID=98403 RepID=A0A151GUV5_DRECN|nr:hypothetical protein DCS_01971 [Drechmeria coniospora]KYK60833.1 hypothetical protein DCS_01971 [Drechmeria coniospora]ODA83529.1 hypothetical protein RJ55_02043 [Drechmeria coniospora]
MRHSIALALGAGQVAWAVTTFSNTTATTAGPTTTPLPGPFLPPRVGAFRVVGCAGSSTRFPGFERTVTEDKMTLEICAAACPGRYFGVYFMDCYCGDVVDDATTSILADSKCSSRCPGKPEEACGGLTNLLQRREIPQTVLLSLYERIAATTTTEPPSGTTMTRTLTSTGIITTCPPEVTDCPLRRKKPSRKMICYGDYCAQDEYCDECERQRVVCDDDDCHTEACPSGYEKYWTELVVCTGGQDYKYSQCSGDACKRKITCDDGKCTVEKCTDDEFDRKFVCRGDDCEHESCTGDECWKKYQCSADSCKVQPVCPGNGTCTAPGSKTYTTPSSYPVQAGSSRVAIVYNLLAGAALAAFML